MNAECHGIPFQRDVGVFWNVERWGAHSGPAAHTGALRHGSAPKKGAEPGL
ncbi:hypothetical protein GCM10018793_50230 [Streptomyces sulfonofaciens]|uniref:Uncharacterized protein n=1 Tax=Streptomyces sulfonofaciens TaxID=68272 RepID=A0A919GHC2_9ACTN|nr:hypothetical protein GCM10018793_50230 [Streptomyces sulfonofaciens]